MKNRNFKMWLIESTFNADTEHTYCKVYWPKPVLNTN